MYVCIIMEYYKLGDMDRVLKQKRRSKEHIEELVRTTILATNSWLSPVSYASYVYS